jgi:hypothetical protein
VCPKVAANARFVEWVYPNTEMIHIASLFSGSCPARPAEFAVHWNEINERSTSTQLNQPELVLPPLDCAAKNAAVEVKHGVEVCDTQYEVVDFPNVDHYVHKAAGSNCTTSRIDRA